MATTRSDTRPGYRHAGVHGIDRDNTLRGRYLAVMSDEGYEKDLWFHTVGFHHVRQDLVDPQPRWAATDEPVPGDEEDGDGDVSVQLDPVDQVARVTITPAPGPPRRGPV